MTSLDDRLVDEDRHTSRPQPSRGAAAAPPKKGKTTREAESRRGDDAREDGRDERDIQDQNNRVLSEDERFALFQSSITQSVLPNLPDMPGYHVCWLTTSNPRDTIAMRIRLGYELITLAMIGGPDEWKSVSLKSGEYPGVISVNEMIAARIPLNLYNRYMREVHETLPNLEEEKLKMASMSAKDRLMAAGSRIDEEGDGTADIVQRAQPMQPFTR